MDYILLDENSIGAFSSLYPGDITECTDAAHISFGAFCEKGPAALIVISFRESELFMEWLFTAEEMRDQGVMTSLLKFACEALDHAGNKQPLHVVCPGERLYDFMIMRGFDEDFSGSWKSYISPLKDMKNMDPKKDLPPNPKLKDLSKNEINTINQCLQKAGESAYGIELPVIPSEYSDYSCAAVSRGELNVLILFTKDQDDIVDISYVYKKKGAEVLLLSMILAAKEDIEKDISSDGKLRAMAINEASCRLFESLFPNAEAQNVYLATRLVG